MATIVITGASMGIGRAMALAWAARKDTVVLSARGRETLEAVALEVETAGGRAIVVPGDVTDEAHRVELVARARETGALDVLVNNAGRGFAANVLAIELEKMRELF
ncbi:MAG TPA: SDR family NAD(P)-dependent oxidoreductase, partial [Labilithrix sp.]